jgi:hypothetical protein
LQIRTGGTLVFRRLQLAAIFSKTDNPKPDMETLRRLAPAPFAFP